MFVAFDAPEAEGAEVSGMFLEVGHPRDIILTLQLWQVQEKWDSQVAAKLEGPVSVGNHRGIEGVVGQEGSCWVCRRARPRMQSRISGAVK